jgi:hypothetical protein
MKEILIILLMVLPATAQQTDSVFVQKMVVNKESHVLILGRSNVNQFTFEMNSYQRGDTLVVVQENKQSAALFREGLLRLPIVDFKNENKGLTNDFREMLKAKDYPDITMTFISLNALPEQGLQQDTLNARVEVNLAGVKKILDFNVLAAGKEGGMTLDGSMDLHFTDFGLVPPSKFLGLIKVKNDLKVNFQLVLSVVKESK